MSQQLTAAAAAAVDTWLEEVYAEVSRTKDHQSEEEKSTVQTKPTPASLRAAKDVAHAERFDFGDTVVSTMSFTYGELLPSALDDVLKHLKLVPSDVLVDLGSGSGKSALYMALMCPLATVYGIELLPGLHALSQNALGVAKRQLRADESQRTQNAERLLQLVPDAAQRLERVHFFLGDILKPSAAFDWAPRKSNRPLADKGVSNGGDSIDKSERIVSTPSVVFCCSTAFDEDLMKGVTVKCRELAVGTRIVTVSNTVGTKSKRDDMFAVTWSGELPSTWGKGTVYIQEKMHNRRLESVIMKAFFK